MNDATKNRLKGMINEYGDFLDDYIEGLIKKRSDFTLKGETEFDTVCKALEFENYKNNLRGFLKDLKNL